MREQEDIMHCSTKSASVDQQAVVFFLFLKLLSSAGIHALP